MVPRLATAFNPFSAIPTVEFLCGFYERPGLGPAGDPAQGSAPSKRRTGCTLEALGELEYYLFFPEDPLFRVEPSVATFTSLGRLEVEDVMHRAPPGEHGVRRQIRSLRGR